MQHLVPLSPICLALLIAATACAAEVDGGVGSTSLGGAGGAHDAAPDVESTPASGGRELDAGGVDGTGGTGNGAGGQGRCDRPVQARRYVEATTCLGPLEEAGCIDSSLGCTEMIIPARAADGTCWSLPHSCLPAGFTPVAPGDPCGPAAYNPPCEDLEDRCPYPGPEGTLVAEASACSSGVRHRLACAASAGCGGELVAAARSPAGACWSFPTYCWPSGFVKVEGCGLVDRSYGACGGTLQTSACEQTVIHARLHDQRRACLEPPEPVGCFHTTCDGPFVPARRDDTTCWLVPAACVPSGFVVAASEDPCSTVTHAPSCSD